MDIAGIIKFFTGGHGVRWVIYHEAWHFLLSLSFSSVLLLVVYFLSSETSWLGGLVSGRTSLILSFLLWASLALVWHCILDIDMVARALRFWWWEL